MPKLYAEGFSARAKKFNCVQRGHQQALETYPQFLALSFIGGLRFPLTCAAGGALWCYARLKWSEGYATGNPSDRYSHFLSVGIWVGLLIQLLAAFIVSITALF